MDRKELYKQIKSLHLENEVKAKYGRNFTQCTSAQLTTVVSGVTKMLEEAAKSRACKKEESILTEVGPSSFQKLVEILSRKKILLKSEVEAIMG